MLSRQLSDVAELLNQNRKKEKELIAKRRELIKLAYASGDYTLSQIGELLGVTKAYVHSQVRK